MIQVPFKGEGMPAQFIDIVNKQTGGKTRVPETAFERVWKERGWERADKVRAKQAKSEPKAETPDKEGE